MIEHESSRRIKVLNVQGVPTGTFATSSLFWFLLKPILNRTQGVSESQPLAKHKPSGLDVGLTSTCSLLKSRSALTRSSDQEIQGACL